MPNQNLVGIGFYAPGRDDGYGDAWVYVAPATAGFTATTGERGVPTAFGPNDVFLDPEVTNFDDPTTGDSVWVMFREPDGEAKELGHEVKPGATLKMSDVVGSGGTAITPGVAVYGAAGAPPAELRSFVGRGRGLRATTIAYPAAPSYGAAAVFTLLGQNVISTGATEVAGQVGGAVDVSGFPDGVSTGGETEGAGPTTAIAAALVAYNAIDSLTPRATLPAEIGGLVLDPGTYALHAATTVNGTLKLNAKGDSGARWAFQGAGTLAIAADADMVIINGTTSPRAQRVDWQIPGAVTVGAGGVVLGTVVAQGAITCGAVVEVAGRLISIGGNVTVNEVMASNAA